MYSFLIIFFMKIEMSGPIILTIKSNAFRYSISKLNVLKFETEILLSIVYTDSLPCSRYNEQDKISGLFNIYSFLYHFFRKIFSFYLIIKGKMFILLKMAKRVKIHKMIEVFYILIRV